MEQYIGEKKPDKVGHVVDGAICLFLALSFIIAIAMLIFARPLALMLQGIAQTFIVRLPMSYFMSIQPAASLTMIGLAAPCATIFGIVINLIYFIVVNRENKYRSTSYK